MHKSDELGATSLLLFDELKALGEISEQISIGIFDEENQVLNLYATLHGEQWKEATAVDLNEPLVMQKIYGGWQQHKKSIQIDLSGKELKAYNHFRSQYSNLKFPDERWVIHCAFFSKGVLSFSTTTPHDAQTMQLLERFAQVFDGTYTRFLDLQKAEAQAWEAQSEAALERVRSRAMAMRHSDELSEAAEILYNEFLKLGVESFSCGYLINDEEKREWQIWLTNPGEPFFKEFWTAPYEADHHLKARYDSWKNKEEFHCTVLEGEENRAHHVVIAKYAPWKSEILDALPPRLVINSAHFSLGHLLVISPDRLAPELEQAMVRFANVFDITYNRFLDLQKAEEQASNIKLVNQENERLLHSILPQPIAEEIRSGRHNVVKRFEEVSILFADIVGFTVMSEKLKPGEVVDILNGLFSKFDDLTDQYGLEKIKTIGDAYMVAAGVPEENADHAMTMFRFAQDMLRSLEEYNLANNSQMKIRIGISSGPVVAGVIGKKKFAYDLWGDSVNTAARMEAYGREGNIQISPSSYALLKNDFAFEKIPGVNIKGKGVMDVYLWKPQPLEAFSMK